MTHPLLSQSYLFIGGKTYSRFNYHYPMLDPIITLQQAKGRSMRSASGSECTVRSHRMEAQRYPNRHNAQPSSSAMTPLCTSPLNRLFRSLAPVLTALGVGAFALSLGAAQRSKASAAAPATPAQRNSIAQTPYIGAILVDAASGRVLFEDKADAPGYPASVLKLMDLLLILERIEQRQLSLQDSVIVSARASKTGGSQVWLAEKEVFTIDELLYALMVQSANDAAVALAEKVAGTPQAFVELMNARAQQLGMTRTAFQSVHGLPPGAGQKPDVTTARDLAILCRELLKRPDTLRYTSTRERPFRPEPPSKTVVMRTHNHVMTGFEGCDGLKTGYFARAGFSVAVTAARNGQRVIAVVLGSADRKVRDAKATELLAKGFVALHTAPKAASPVATRPVPAGQRPAKPASR
jgi:D-alanyl-D-alanine carboxypeptidase (penicillin-binding protein 5/6)